MKFSKLSPLLAAFGMFAALSSAVHAAPVTEVSEIDRPFSALGFDEDILKTVSPSDMADAHDMDKLTALMNTPAADDGSATIVPLSPGEVSALRHAISQNGSFVRGNWQSGWKVSEHDNLVSSLTGIAYRYDYGKISLPDMQPKHMTLAKDGGILVIINRQPDLNPVGFGDKYKREWIVAVPTSEI